MTKKLKCILLIDDDEATNYIHRRVITEIGCAENVVAVQSGQAALDYLNEQINGIHPQLDLIFLDINMPAMNGWEFLEHYKSLSLSKKAKTVLVMLTTSLNPDDLTQATSIVEVDGFESKPLNEEKMNRTLKQHFSGL